MLKNNHFQNEKIFMNKLSSNVMNQKLSQSMPECENINRDGEEKGD